MIRAAIAVVALLAAAAGPVRADAGTAALLREAGSALAAGDHARAATLAGPLTTAPGIDRAERSEALRVYGLALFHAGSTAEAEAAVLAHLKLEPDAHLDPAVFPPEVIVFFEDVRARHAAEINATRPLRPDTIAESAKDWLPPWGQIQNGHRGKALVLGATGLVLVAANLTSAMLLYRWCSEADGTCSSGNRSRREEAIMLRRVNIISLVALLPWYVYGVWDARAHHGRSRAERSYISLGVDASPDGGHLVFGGSF